MFHTIEELPFNMIFIGYFVGYYADDQAFFDLDRNAVIDFKEDTILIQSSEWVKKLKEIDEFTLTFSLCKSDKSGFYCGIPSSTRSDEQLNSYAQAQFVNAPYMPEFPLVIECKKIKNSVWRIPAQIVNIAVNPTLLDNDGKFDLSILFNDLSFTRIADPPAQE